MNKPEIEIFGLRRNALVITITGVMLSTGRLFAKTFFSLYVLHLGANVIVLGLFSSIQGLTKAILLAPLGYLGDRVGHQRKWIIVACDGLVTLAYLTFTVADSWIWLIPGIILETNGLLALPISNSIVSDGINPDKRGIAYATRALPGTLGTAFVPFLGGVLLDAIGMEQGMRVLFMIGALLRGIGTVSRAIFIKEKGKRAQTSEVKASAETRAEGKIKGTVLDMLKPFFSTKTLQVMAIISCTGSIGTNVLMRFQVVYAEKVIGLSHTEWGLVSSVAGTFGNLIRIPLGKLSDIFGRRKCILIDYSIRPIYFVALVNVKSFTQLLLLNSLNTIAGEAGSPAWQALIIDITPRGSRGRVLGAFAMISAAMETVFPSVAAVLWQALGPAWTFYLPAFVDALAFLFAYLRLREPKRREG